MRLSEQQIRAFDTFGFLALPGLIADRVDDVIAGFERVWQANGGGHHGRPHDGQRRSCLPNIYRAPEIIGLIDDPRLVGVSESLLGDDYNFVGGDGNLYAGDTGWHSDGWGLVKRRWIKIAFYLDPLDAGSGCLRVIPGSHRHEAFGDELERHIKDPVATYGMDGHDVPCVPLPTRPGDVLVFDFHTKHAAYGGGRRRRMFTMNCCARYGADDIGEFRDVLGGWSRFWAIDPYPPEVLADAPPSRMRHLEQQIANFGHVRELTLRAMATMAEPARG